MAAAIEKKVDEALAKREKEAESKEEAKADIMSLMEAFLASNKNASTVAATKSGTPKTTILRSILKKAGGKKP